MNEIRVFEDLECWQFGRELTGLVYRVTNEAVRAKDYGFADQMRRAALSVINNVGNAP